MTTVAGFDVDELAAKIILRAIISPVGGAPLIVDLDLPTGPTDHHDTQPRSSNP